MSLCYHEPRKCPASYQSRKTPRARYYRSYRRLPLSNRNVIAPRQPDIFGHLIPSSRHIDRKTVQFKRIHERYAFFYFHRHGFPLLALPLQCHPPMKYAAVIFLLIASYAGFLGFAGISSDGRGGHCAVLSG